VNTFPVPTTQNDETRNLFRGTLHLLCSTMYVQRVPSNPLRTYRFKLTTIGTN